MMIVRFVESFPTASDHRLAESRHNRSLVPVVLLLCRIFRHRPPYSIFFGLH